MPLRAFACVWLCAFVCASVCSLPVPLHRPAFRLGSAHGRLDIFDFFFFSRHSEYWKKRKASPSSTRTRLWGVMVFIEVRTSRGPASIHPLIPIALRALQTFANAAAAADDTLCPLSRDERTLLKAKAVAIKELFKPYCKNLRFDCKRTFFFLLLPLSFFLPVAPDHYFLCCWPCL